MIGNPYKGRGFGGLIRYLHEGRANERNPHRVIWSEAGNLPTNDPKIVAGIMRATAALSRGVKKPVYHLPISWPPEEQLPQEMQVQIARQLLSDLGLSEHQHLIVAHDDGDCPHIHLVVNTVHPETGRVWSAWRDVYRIMESLERQEKELSLQIVHRPDLEEHRSGVKDPDRKKGSSREERKRAEREGDTPLSKWSEKEMRSIRNDITTHFKQAVSWADLETRLRQHGLQLRRAGQGFRITDGNHFMTMSKIGKHAREERLEERFNESWDDYQLTRDMPDELAAQLEPPDAKKPESGLEEMDMLFADKQAEQRAAESEKVKRALSAVAHHEHRQQTFDRARALTQREVELLRAKRRNDVILGRVQSDVEQANAEFLRLTEQCYRNPAKARQNIEKELRNGKSFDEIDLGKVGKARGWGLLGWRSKARRDAGEGLPQLRRSHQQLYRLKNQQEMYSHDELVLQAKLSDAAANSKELRQELGATRAERIERSREVASEMSKALREIDQNDIWQSALPDEAKELLARKWEEHIERRRQRERDDVARDMSRFGQDERERDPYGWER